MFTGGRAGCYDHGSGEGKTVSNNVRAWWKRQNKKLEQGNLKGINIQEIA
jgi:alpha/beta superfamily hydrolase